LPTEYRLHASNGDLTRPGNSDINLGSKNKVKDRVKVRNEG